VNAGGGATKINPLQAPPLPADAEDDDEEAGLSAVALHAQRAKTVFELYLSGGLTPMRRALLSRALRDVYEAAGIGTDTDPATVPADRWPHVGHLYEYAKRHARPTRTGRLSPPSSRRRPSGLRPSCGRGVPPRRLRLRSSCSTSTTSRTPRTT
jgi:hypothetical protein